MMTKRDERDLVVLASPHVTPLDLAMMGRWMEEYIELVVSGRMQ